MAINSESAAYCFLDLDFDNHRRKLSVCAAFVDATDTRYGFMSKDLRLLGGSELARIQSLIATDHEWSSRNNECGGIEVRPPSCGNRIVVKLFWDVAPLACQNFATLCANGSLIPGIRDKRAKPAPIGESGKPLTYRGTIVHRIIPGFVMQGGDLVFGNGSGGESVYNGKKFKDERAGLNMKHGRKGILSMGNSGKNSNSSQFFFTLKATPQCDGKHVVFGEIISGFEVLDHAEALGTASGNPSAPVTITDCGVFRPFYTPGAGYWYDQPDTTAFNGISSVFMVRPRAVLIAPSQAVAEKFQKALRLFVVSSPLVVDAFENESHIASAVKEQLERFSTDLVVVAPACKHVLSEMKLPKSWDEDILFDNVIIEAKPIGALAAIRTKSWMNLRNSWQLDGALGYQ